MKWRNWKSLLSTLLISLLIGGGMLVLAHFSLQLGLENGEISAFLSRTRGIWLGVRLAIYMASGYFLWKIYQTAQTADEQQAYRKLNLATIVTIVVIELLVWL